MCPNNCPACCHYLSMSDELAEALRDANRICKEKFNNAYEASKLVEKGQKQRKDSPPADAEAPKAKEEPKTEEEQCAGSKAKDVDLSPEEEDD
eukprot:4718244-Karenia_brevis.AAC.1